jgi:hypothetical protein
VNHQPGVLGILGSAHLDGQLQLVGKCSRGTERLAGLGFGRLPLVEQIAQRVEVAAKALQAAGCLELLLVRAGLAQDVLGLFGAGPEVRSRRLLF